VPNTTVPAGGYKPRFARSEFAGARVSVVLSPDTSSLANSSVLGLIGSAAKTLYVEQLSCTLSWDSDRGKRPNEYLEAVVDAARRGVRVRLLLDGTYIDDTDSGEGNAGVVNYLAYTAAREGLDLQARTAAIPGTLKLHNKGVIVDGGKVLVSSINWGQNSVFGNREVGLIIDGAGPASYYEQVFLYDWNCSAGAPSPGGGNGTMGGEPAKDSLAGALRGLSVLLPLAAVAAAVLLFVRRSARRRDYHSPRSRSRR